MGYKSVTLAVDLWPSLDRARWVEANRAGDPLDEDGRAAHWSETTRRQVAKDSTTGRIDEGLVVIDATIRDCEMSGYLWCMPEMLRVKGELLARRADGERHAAEVCFMQALDWVRRQEALSWELRTATSLAELWHGRGKSADAHQLLSSVYNRFSEGFETCNLRTARALINELRGTPARSQAHRMAK